MILKCRICGTEFTEDEAVRDTKGNINLDQFGKYWCENCIKLFDIDVNDIDMIYER